MTTLEVVEIDKKQYFTQATEDAIVRYINSEDFIEKHLDKLHWINMLLFGVLLL